MEPMSYRLNDLGAHEFEHLVQALLVRLYGPTVGVFGSGPDSGRDGTLRGRSDEIRTIEGRAVLQDAGQQQSTVWNGYHVFQVKFREQPLGTGPDLTWFLNQVRTELTKWTDPKKGRKGPRPEYIVFVTNVALSGQIGGGLDRATDVIRMHADKHGWPLKDCQVWDRTKVTTLLDTAADVRQRFNGLLTVGDVLASLRQMTRGELDPDTVRTTLEEHMRSELRNRAYVNLSEAGQIASERIDLTTVAVDLPSYPDLAADAHRPQHTMKKIVAAGDAVLRPEVYDGEPEHFLIVGGPGQGKTTLGRFLLQLYQANILADQEGLSAPVARAVADVLARAEGIGIQRPRNRRWPVRVDLAEYADKVGGGEDTSLLRYIASRIAAQTDLDLHARDLRKWLSAWPWLLILDGYDEVAARPARETVAKAVSQLLETAHAEDADLLVLATTRPQGYSNELPSSFRQVRLAPLLPGEAVAYATALVHARLGESQDVPGILQRIADAVENPLTSRLMQTPLQVMFMTLLLEHRKKPPQDRAELFQRYYDVIYDRETAKTNHLAKLLHTYRADVDAIHQAVGLTLQRSSEAAGDAEAILTRGEFTALVRDQLGTAGHEGPDLDNLVEELMKAAQHRLVLLVAKGKDGVGFDLRSLQEFMAARALIDAPDHDVLERLRTIAPSAHWRNTWQLAVGLIHRTRSYLFNQVLQLLRELDSATIGLVIKPGPHLAIDILDDGVANASPVQLRLLLTHALDVLQGVSLGAGRLAEALVEVGDESAVRTQVTDALARAVNGDPGERHSALVVLDHLAESAATGPLFVRARQLRDMARRAPEIIEPVRGNTVRLADALPKTAAAWPKSSPRGRFYADLRTIVTAAGTDGTFRIPSGSIQAREATIEVLDSDDDLLEVAQAITEIEPANWPARSAITALIWRAYERRPVGPLPGR